MQIFLIKTVIHLLAIFAIVAAVAVNQDPNTIVIKIDSDVNYILRQAEIIEYR